MSLGGLYRHGHRLASKDAVEIGDCDLIARLFPQHSSKCDLRNTIKNGWMLRFRDTKPIFWLLTGFFSLLLLRSVSHPPTLLKNFERHLLSLGSDLKPLSGFPSPWLGEHAHYGLYLTRAQKRHSNEPSHRKTIRPVFVQERHLGVTGGKTLLVGDSELGNGAPTPTE